MKSLINRTAVKEYALHLSKTKRGGKFTRVSRCFLDAIQAVVINALVDRVHQHPSLGKTLK